MVDLDWSENSRASHQMNLGLDGREYRILKNVAEQVSPEPQIGANSIVASVIRGIINSSLNTEELDTPISESGPDSSAKIRVNVSDDEYQIIQDSIHKFHLKPSTHNHRPLCRKARQEFIIPFIQEVEQ